MRRWFSFLCIVSISVAGEIITNGDFEQELTIGWEQVAAGYYSIVDRATDYDPDPDYEARAFDSLGSYAKLWQVVSIPTTDLEFSVNAKVYAYDNNADEYCWAAAAVIISYLDESGSLLGDTRICTFTSPCPWQNSSTCHIIFVANSNWNNYAFNIDDELANLSGVNPTDVKKIEVALYAKTEHTC